MCVCLPHLQQAASYSLFINSKKPDLVIYRMEYKQALLVLILPCVAGARKGEGEGESGARGTLASFTCLARAHFLADPEL